MGQVLWTWHFLAAQGEYMPSTTIYQDNKSTILLAENGKASSGKRTRHLNIRYLLITDQIKKGHVKVAFCPTQDMIADFFTKPLQGSLFMRMREKILNLPASEVANVHRSVLKECTKADERNPRTKNTINAGESKNDQKETKQIRLGKNKTEENKNKSYDKTLRPDKAKKRIDHNFLIYSDLYQT